MKNLSHLPWNKISISFAIIALAIQFSVQIYLAKNDAQTTDEAIHLLAGYVYLTDQRFEFNAEHPPLAKTLAGLPLLAINPNVPESQYWEEGRNFFYDGVWAHRDLGEAFLYKTGNDADLLLFWGRFPTVILTMLLGLTVYAIATKLWGWTGGIVAVALYAFDPTINAHGHFVTTDIAATLGMLLSVYTFWLLMEKITLQRFLALGAVLGFAFASKFSALGLLPILFVLFVARLITDTKVRQRWLPIVGTSIASLFIAWLVIAASYQFQITPAPKTDSIIDAVYAANVSATAGIPAEIKTKANNLYNDVRTFLVPSNYFKGTFLVYRTVTIGRSAFLFGEYSGTGWWYYFPVLILTKTIIPSLLLMVAGAYLTIRNATLRKTGGYILLAGLTYLAFTMTSKANIGLRHAMPVLPFLFISAGAVAHSLTKRSAGFVGVALIWLIATYAVAFPFYLPYFNEFVGGSYNGYKVSTDSNTDWGQDLKRIKQYMDEKGIETAYLEYYWDGLSSPGYYGITYTYVSDFKVGTDTGYLIIAATSLQSEKYAWLKDYEPVDRVSPSVMVYKFE